MDDFRFVAAVVDASLNISVQAMASVDGRKFYTNRYLLEFGLDNSISGCLDSGLSYQLPTGNPEVCVNFQK